MTFTSCGNVCGFWGSPAKVGSLCNMREIVRRLQVDKGVKVFNVGDEFLIHVFKSHFTASILPILNIQTSSEAVNTAVVAKYS